MYIGDIIELAKEIRKDEQEVKREVVTNNTLYIKNGIRGIQITVTHPNGHFTVHYGENRNDLINELTEMKNGTKKSIHFFDCYFSKDANYSLVRYQEGKEYIFTDEEFNSMVDEAIGLQTLSDITFDEFKELVEYADLGLLDDGDLYPCDCSMCDSSYFCAGAMNCNCYWGYFSPELIKVFHTMKWLLEKDIQTVKYLLGNEAQIGETSAEEILAFYKNAPDVLEEVAKESEEEYFETSSEELHEDVVLSDEVFSSTPIEDCDIPF